MVSIPLEKQACISTFQQITLQNTQRQPSDTKARAKTMRSNSPPDEAVKHMKLEINNEHVNYCQAEHLLRPHITAHP